MLLQPWFHCKCGKLHTANFVSHLTVCSCGELLWPQIPFKFKHGKVYD